MLNKLVNNSLALSISLVICGIALAFFSFFIVTRTSIKKGEEQISSKIFDSAFIYRNKFNIPHIIARNEHDVFFAMGYAHAQDRLWQMDIIRRTGRGLLSEIFGKEALETDKFMRMLSLVPLAEKLYNKSSKTTKFMLEAYSEGVNYYLKEHPEALPFEFGALSYQPKEWHPTDCIIIGRLMAVEMNTSMWSDIAIGELADKFGVPLALQMIPSNDAHTVYQYESQNTVPTTNEISSLANVDTDYLADIDHKTKTFTNARTYLGLSSDGIGSNAWVMRKNAENLQDKSVILANDPHLKLGLPAKWYQCHLSCPGLNVLGVSMPGLPIIISGRNSSVSWGITNMMADDFDYFIEKTSQYNNNYYFTTTGDSVKFKYKRDTINIKNDEPLIYDIRYSKRSAIISDASPISLIKNNKDSTKSNKNIFTNYCMSYEWTGNAITDEFLAIYRMMKSDNWSDFQKGFLTWGAPCLNFVYGDIYGTIAGATVGILPIRGPKANPNIPSPGWIPEYSWQGIHKSTDLPKHSYTLYNREKKFIASANNPLLKYPPFYHSSLWEPSSRAKRLELALQQFDEYDVRDAQFLQYDVHSPYAEDILAKVLPILVQKKKFMPVHAKRALEKLKKWKCFITNQDVEPAIYTLLIDNLFTSIFSDQLPEHINKEYKHIASFPTRILLQSLEDSPEKWNHWFDDYHTKNKIEDKSEIIYKAFIRAVKQGTTIYNSDDINTWKYRYLHTITLEHLFSKSSLMKPVVTHGPFPHSGNNTTLNNGSWAMNNPFKQVLGASMRIVSDMQDSVMYCVLPGGSSGEPLSSHYSDQVQLWLNGGYIKLPVQPKPASDVKLFTTFVRK